MFIFFIEVILAQFVVKLVILQLANHFKALLKLGQSTSVVDAAFTFENPKVDKINAIVNKNFFKFFIKYFLKCKIKFIHIY